MYNTTVVIYELGEDGEQVGEPHVYKERTETLEDAKKVQTDLLWEAVEVECLGGELCKVDTAIELEPMQYVDSDTAFMRADVEYTDSPSRFVRQSDWNLTVYAVDRERSRLFVSDNLADLEDEE